MWQRCALGRSGSALDLSTSEPNVSTGDDAIMPNKEGKLRRVFTAHVRRRKKHGQFLRTMMKEPLRVVHSVPLNFTTCGC
uniref:Uncharacterized protein n=1 Tax=Strigamia maritima TaxID=126957 RepID=T1JMG0_STRMM